MNIALKKNNIQKLRKVIKMADIQTYLDQIKNAQYGKDVRQSIHDGIKQCYEDGKAGAIDLTAREDIAALNSDIDALNSALGDLKFTRQVFNNVSTNYSDDNRIRYNGDVINAETFPSSVWLIVLNGTETTGAGSMCLALAGTETPKMEIVVLGKNSGTYPVVRATTTSGLLYVVWSNTRNAYIAANVFKLS